MTKIVRIDPDGSVHDIDGENLIAAARAAFETIDIVTCRAPFYDGFLVGAIDDWGRTKGMPLNRKAWAAYGRSPIYGPMFLAHDQDEAGHRVHLDDALVALLHQPLDEIVRPEVLARMQELIEGDLA